MTDSNLHSKLYAIYRKQGSIENEEKKILNFYTSLIAALPTLNPSYSI